LSKFLPNLVRDGVAVGGDATVKTKAGLKVRIKPVAMHRALRNVVENTIRYGQSAKITAGSTGKLEHIALPKINDTRFETLPNKKDKFEITL